LLLDCDESDYTKILIIINNYIFDSKALTCIALIDFQLGKHYSLKMRSISNVNRQFIRKKYTLVLVRHGESSWNKENKFTGWYDCPLSDKGNDEARQAGILLNNGGYKFDIAYTSYLKRAIKTLWHSLEQTDSMYVPIVNAWQLNERHYGALQGLDKQETVKKYGKDQVNVWRRSYDIPPPECDPASIHYPPNDPKYASVKDLVKIKTESLKVLYNWFTNIDLHLLFYQCMNVPVDYFGSCSTLLG
jgi:bisphosphoglycerate-dependent phosphoglycerate mutase